MNHNTMHINDLIATADANTAGPALDDGMYPATIVGYSINESTFQQPDGSTNTSIGAKLIYQILDDNGKTTHVQGVAMKASLHEKATLRKMLSTWLKSNDIKGIVDALVNAKIVVEEKFTWDGFIGRTPTLMINMTAGKTNPAKMYPQIKSVIPSKVSAQHAFIPSEIPWFMIDGALEYKLMDGITVAPKRTASTHPSEASQKTNIDGFTATTPVDADLPF